MQPSDVNRFVISWADVSVNLQLNTTCSVESFGRIGLIKIDRKKLIINNKMYFLQHFFSNKSNLTLRIVKKIKEEKLKSLSEKLKMLSFWDFYTEYICKYENLFIYHLARVIK